ncbi:SSI family serine proteinase inhibitor [Streptomyces longwoodensis]|uniref:SSI family serine proteinase inhibitor n=1 Tax=Streptomyces longwoodensis TaxID=68231 RepID=UPI00340FF056
MAQISATSATPAPTAAPTAASTPARRRLGALGVVSALASLAALAPFATLSAHASPSAAPLAPPPVRDEDRPGYGRGDQLVVTVRDSGVPGADGVYQLSCHPGGGSHPHADAACAALDRNSVWGRDAFAPVPEGSVCTLQYGGPATAHVTGRWAGRPVDATFERANGCEIERWDRFVPLLPEVSTGRPASRPPADWSQPSRPSRPSHPAQPADPSRPASHAAHRPSTRPAPHPLPHPLPHSVQGAPTLLPAPLPEPAPEPRPAR